ncbi:DNA metabolism protein [Dyadobacter endophyticus]|uniref:DNA metabolism protein n=1 Tax=Dyadobacter endophyticus TaxID=1749036 RepID=A0ABQ1YLA7_9BACT|nr:TIGR03915 family putative DNA repair protein [Dyadobacter endophyticus]GGH28397.1 DNA metabolism protein [Dyadobacter endophyticus]
MELYIFDGSLEGLLTAVFECYQRKSPVVKLVTATHHVPDVFDAGFRVVSDREKGKRVWKGLCKKLGKEWQFRFYKAFLSEQPETFQHLLNFARYIIDQPAGACENFAHPDILAVSQTAQKVHREKHRMEAFVRFQKTGDGIYYAHIEPDFDVLPLLPEHFQNRYADQRWIIYDLTRKYGMYYNLEKTEEIELDVAPQISVVNALPSDLLDPGEQMYTLLWQDYFKSTNIQARKNMRLHVRHVPRRYWKCLSEKQG